MGKKQRDKAYDAIIVDYLAIENTAVRRLRWIEAIKGVIGMPRNNSHNGNP